MSCGSHILTKENAHSILLKGENPLQSSEYDLITFVLGRNVCVESSSLCLFHDCLPETRTHSSG